MKKAKTAMIRAIFLDRDGTLNYDEEGYINKPEDFNLFPFSLEALTLLKSLDYKLIVVSNQSGIARGLFTFEDLEKIHHKMQKELENQIDEIFICPYHKDGKIKNYSKEHIDRKPNLGMFYKAKEKYAFSIKDSFMIGDKYSDIEFGKKANLNTILVLSGDGEKTFREIIKEKKMFSPDYVVINIFSAAKLIEKLDKQNTNKKK